MRGCAAELKKDNKITLQQFCHGDASNGQTRPAKARRQRSRTTGRAPKHQDAWLLRGFAPARCQRPLRTCLAICLARWFVGQPETPLARYFPEHLFHHLLASQPASGPQPQHGSSGQGFHTSKPTRPCFLLACILWQDTRLSPAGQARLVQGPEPEPQGQRPPLRQRQSAPTCLQTVRRARKPRAPWQQCPSYSLTPHPHMAASHEGPGQPGHKMNRLGPCQPGRKAQASHAQHGPHLKLAA